MRRVVVFPAPLVREAEHLACGDGQVDPADRLDGLAGDAQGPPAGRWSRLRPGLGSMVVGTCRYSVRVVR